MMCVCVGGGGVVIILSASYINANGWITYTCTLQGGPILILLRNRDRCALPRNKGSNHTEHLWLMISRLLLLVTRLLLNKIWQTPN